MKTLINISLIFAFTMSFVACEKEVIMPVNSNNQNDQTEVVGDFDEFENGNRATISDDGTLIIDSVTDPDEDEDFDGTDVLDTVTDPDEDDDFDGQEGVTDPDEDDDFDGTSH